ncbi:glyoxalase/bleomycin resistance protein/dioxygenase [gamma proteobacterium NOR5-3]|nr:glyoxalase/bleomycin resistance protein/dioxygenase [gamma proteobacterium NOR5-3]
MQKPIISLLTVAERLMTSPILALEHIRITVTDLDTEIGHYTALLGPAPSWRGSSNGHERAIFNTDNVAVHLVASEQAQGLEAICFAVDSLERMHRRLKRVGIDSHETPAEDPGVAAASPKMHVASSADTRGIQISFTERDSGIGTREPSAANGLDHIVIASRRAEGTAFLLGSQLGLDMRMDMSRAEWKARLMFFRCGDLIVEVFEQLDQDGTDAKDDASSQQDSFYGLTWRVADADASHARLTQAGFDVSEVRKGRKPGSQVLTVRNNTAGVATLLIELPAT